MNSTWMRTWRGMFRGLRCLRASCLLAVLFSAGALGQGFLCAVGGGSEDYHSWSDIPYGWIVQKADSGKIIVLSANLEDRWIPNYFQWLGADTAFNCMIATASAANDSATYRAITQCRGVFIKGGDQWDYVANWRGTLTQQAIREVFLSGGVVAGTSAGAAVLGDVVFDARYGSAVSRTALRNPRSLDLTLTTDFLSLVPNCYFDSHFYERARFGRLLAIMAKFQKDTGRQILGIGLESETAVCISPDGIGEVMGAGSAVFYYPTDLTRIRADVNQPLIYTDIQCDALVAGYTYDLNSHEVHSVPADAVVPGPGSSEPGTNAVFLYGDAFPSPAGLDQFIASAGGVGKWLVVITSPSALSMGQRYADTLLGRGASHAVVIPLDSSGANNASYADTISRADGIVFTSNLTEGFPAYTDSLTLVGRALHSALASGVALAYAYQDSKLAGSAVVFRTELEELAAYRGKLIAGKGMNALRNLVVMPLIFQSDVYDWNRVAGLLWAMAKTDGKTGLYLDEGSYADIDRRGIVQSQGLTPAIVVDARNATYVGFSAFRHPGSAGPRQSAACIGARIHSISGDVKFNSVSGEIITSVKDAEQNTPASSLLVWNYPNPFNPVTTIEFSIERPQVADRAESGRDRRRVSLKVLDVLGREVAQLIDEELPPGTYTTQFDGARCSSGIYFAHLEYEGRTTSHGILLLK